MGDVVRLALSDEAESQRLCRFVNNCGMGVHDAAAGSPDEWAWSAVSYLKGALTGTSAGAAGGSVNVSAAAIGVVLGYVERLAVQAGVIP